MGVGLSGSGPVQMLKMDPGAMPPQDPRPIHTVMDRVGKWERA